ncbi:MAG TPA: hypothetical protein VK726_02890 [Acetobacteraceae bacterium]|nr:hypothetical protein [Acetobacteraceae bacterium]
MRIDTIQLAFEAAAMGLGVALGRRPLVDRDLAAGTLVALGPDPIVAESAYWLVSSDAADRRPDFLGCKHWVIAAAAAIESDGAHHSELQYN